MLTYIRSTEGRGIRDCEMEPRLGFHDPWFNFFHYHYVLQEEVYPTFDPFFRIFTPTYFTDTLPGIYPVPLRRNVSLDVNVKSLRRQMP